MDANYILAINPGATSTKIAVYGQNKFVFLKNIRHEYDDLQSFEKTTGYPDIVGACLRHLPTGLATSKLGNWFLFSTHHIQVLHLMCSLLCSQGSLLLKI